jgi:hypothetical protein
MKDAIKTAKEQFKNCTWWGNSGEALPARHVAPLFAEINRLRNETKALRLDLDEKNVQLKKQVIEILSGVRAAKIAVNVMRKAGVFSTNYLDAKMAGQVVQWLDESINYDPTEEGLKDD